MARKRKALTEEEKEEKERKRQERLAKPRIGETVNSNNGEVDDDELSQLLEQMYEEGWIDGDFDELKKGDRIRYTRTDIYGKYVLRVGGWVTVIDEDGKYLIYRGHVGKSYSLQKVDIDELWVLPAKIKKNKEEY